MDRRGRHLEEALHVDLCGRSAIDFGVGLDEGQVLTLKVGPRQSWNGHVSRVFRHGLPIMIRFSEEWKESRMNVRYRIDLTSEERKQLEAFVSSGSQLTRKVKRAQVLLAADAGVQDSAISRAISIGTATIYRTKRRFVEGGIDHAINDDPRPGQVANSPGKRRHCSSQQHAPTRLKDALAGPASCWPVNWCN
jgi:hypothetical protein